MQEWEIIFEDGEIMPCGHQLEGQTWSYEDKQRDILKIEVTTEKIKIWVSKRPADRW
jgi:hypothetical protein